MILDERIELVIVPSARRCAVCGRLIARGSRAVRLSTRHGFGAVEHALWHRLCPEFCGLRLARAA